PHHESLAVLVPEVHQGPSASRELRAEPYHVPEEPGQVEGGGKRGHHPEDGLRIGALSPEALAQGPGRLGGRRMGHTLLELVICVPHHPPHSSTRSTNRSTRTG